MLRSRVGIILLALLLTGGGVSLAQQPMGHEEQIANPIPPPLPKRQPPDENEVPEYDGVITESELPWEIPEELIEPLFGSAEQYARYTERFTCDETVRTADYDAGGMASGEKEKHYGYLLLRRNSGNGLEEYRQKLGKDGQLKQGEVKDEEPFPPAYSWVFLFSRYNGPSMQFRYIGRRFDGFDWVHEIQFRGSHPWSDGKDIRQWEGTALVDAVTFTPIDIRAEPSGQQRRIEARYREYNRSFNIMGFRTAPKPLGFRAGIQFRYRQDGLSFPTNLRYDTFRAVSRNQILSVKSATRSYDRYRIFVTETDPTIGNTVDR